MTILEEPNEQLQIRELFGRQWTTEVGQGLMFYQPLEFQGQQISDINRVRQTISGVNSRIALLYPEISISQQIVLCPDEFYVQRFIDKAKRFGFDPKPWIDWSEGDIDSLDGVGKLFCIRVGANFQSPGDEERFYAHELDHPYSAVVSPIFNGSSSEILLADTEGLVEADARLALGVQERADMEFSRAFMTQLSEKQLAKPAEIELRGYDHLAFINKTVSLNPGYASCFLWFVGQTMRAGNFNGNTVLRDQYLAGRKKLLDIASRAKTKAEYKGLLLTELGFDYDKEANGINVLLEARTALFTPR